VKKNATDQQIIAEMTAARDLAAAAHKQALDNIRSEYERKLTAAQETARKLQATVERQTGIIDLLNEQVATLQTRVRDLEADALVEARAAMAERIRDRLLALMGEG
jgi:predicted nucleic acid-binding protein